jgi:tRNA threonylcarbamoyladenosine biosynthesis protein TsaE
VEWPEQGRGFLPEPDLRIELVPEADGRSGTLIAGTVLGKAVIQCLASG